MAKINPDFVKDLKNIGTEDFKACFNCGTCTATCPLSTDENSFPRNMIRYSVLGLESEIKSSVDPWLCYYCGECSTSCPRQADPGNLMMSLRRWLITQYDWTGISRIFHKSKIWEIVGLFIVAAIVFLIWTFSFGLPGDTDKIFINELAPSSVIHKIDLVVAILLSSLLVSFIFNMYYNIIIKDKSVKIPFKLYFTQIGKMVFHFLTQWHFSECETKPKSFFQRLKQGQYNFWIVHWWLMSSYTLMFIMIIFFLSWFQTDIIYPWWHPQRLFGYYATGGLIIGTLYFYIKRIKKNDERSKFSHHTDWTFIILLFLTAITGIIMNIFRVNEVPVLWTYYVYLIHLMIAIPMLVVEVPFTKWAHLAYRPLAIYFNELKMAAKKQN